MAAATAANGKGFQPDTDVHVTFEDQSKINRFAKHNAKLEDLKNELKIKKNALKNIEEAGDEIELFDDDEQVPVVVGEVFIQYKVSDARVLLEETYQKKQQEIKNIEEKCTEIQGYMAELKGQLYRRFGTNIYLENDE